MLASADDRSRESYRDVAHGTMLPDVDPTDDINANAHDSSQPERRLFFAILADAIVRFRRLVSAPRQVTRELLEAERWIRSDDRQWPCSFLNVCEALDIASETSAPCRASMAQEAGRPHQGHSPRPAGETVSQPRRPFPHGVR